MLSSPPSTSTPFHFFLSFFSRPSLSPLRLVFAFNLRRLSPLSNLFLVICDMKNPYTPGAAVFLLSLPAPSSPLLSSLLSVSPHPSLSSIPSHLSAFSFSSFPLSSFSLPPSPASGLDPSGRERGTPLVSLTIDA